MKRSLCTHLDLLKPSLQSRVRAKQADQKNRHDFHSRDRSFNIGQSVLVRNPRDGPKWIPGIVIEQTGPISYKVQVHDQIWRRHVDQLLDHNVVVEPCLEETAQDRELPDTRVPLVPVTLPESNTSTETEPSVTGPALPEHSEAVPDSSTQRETPVSRHPQRDRKLTDCLTSSNLGGRKCGVLKCGVLVIVYWLLCIMLCYVILSN